MNYYFECMNALLDGHIITGIESDQEAQQIAADYEAELHRYILTGGAGARHEQLTRLQW